MWVSHVRAQTKGCELSSLRLVIFASSALVAMAPRKRPAAAMRRPAADTGAMREPFSGPLVGSGNRSGWARRQYCWWITFSHPYDATVQRQNLRTPSSFTREAFLEVVRAAHASAGVVLEEVAIFKEMHQRTDSAGERLPHLNAMVRASDQYAWSGVARRFYEDYHVAVDFAEHIRTWYDGVVYGVVPSQHKPEVDDEPFQWARSGTPVPFKEVLPAKFNAMKARQPKISSLQAYDLCMTHHLRSETEV